MAAGNVDLYVDGGSFSAPYYRFYTDPSGQEELTDLSLDTGSSYTFRRLGGATSHPFYLSDTGYEQSSSSDIEITGDGSPTSGIRGSQSFTLTFNENADEINDLLYYCSSHSLMQGSIKIEVASGNITGGVLTHEDAQVLLQQGTDVVIPEGITSISNSAFRETPLTSVQLPSTLTNIGDTAFLDTQLTSVVIPNSVTLIGDSAFSESNLMSVLIGNSVIKIGENAFSDDEVGGGNQLTSIMIPDSVVTIGDRAFSTNKLESVILGSGIKTLGRFSFYRNKLANISIPGNVEEIGEGAFQINELESVFIPESIKSINSEVFSDNQLERMDIENNYDIRSIDEFAFSRNNLTSADIPDSVISIGDGAYLSNQLTTVDIPDAVTSIGDIAFADNQLSNLAIPSNVQSIGESAFERNQLTHIVIPDSVISIGDRAFADNPLESISISEDASFGLFIYENAGVEIIRRSANTSPINLFVSVSSYDENIASSSVSANLSSTDVDSGDLYTYSLIPGDGDTDNSAFTIIGDQLKVIKSTDYEAQNSYSIRLQTEDSDGLSFEKSFTFAVNDLNEVPTNLLIAASSFNENIAAASAVATLNTIDADSGDTFTYSLVSGT